MLYHSKKQQETSSIQHNASFSVSTNQQVSSNVGTNSISVIIGEEQIEEESEVDTVTQMVDNMNITYDVGAANLSDEQIGLLDITNKTLDTLNDSKKVFRSVDICNFTLTNQNKQRMYCDSTSYLQDGSALKVRKNGKIYWKCEISQFKHIHLA